MAIAVERRSFVVTCRLDDKGVSLPMTHGPSIPPRIQVWGKCSPVRIDLAKTKTEAIPRLEDLQYFTWGLNELNVPSRAEASRITLRIACPVSFVQIAVRRIIAGLMGVELFPTPYRQGRSWSSTHQPIRDSPDPRQVMRIIFECALGRLCCLLCLWR